MSDNCPFCGKPIDPASRYSLRRVTGWERKAIGPSRKHGSDIVFREPLDEWAHGGCISAAKHGLLGQESMFGR
jgi:hypothetical protein